MVKIERNPISPPSLAVEEQKARGVYNKPDVIQRLRKIRMINAIFVNWEGCPIRKWNI